MIVYEADKKQFLHQSDYDDIENVILASVKTATGKSVSNSEIRSWRESLRHVAMVLRDDDIPNEMGIAVELHIPQSSKRIDVTLTGRDDAGNKNAVVIELKQWGKATAIGLRRELTGGRLNHLVAGNTMWNPAYRQHVMQNMNKNWGRAKGGKVSE